MDWRTIFVPSIPIAEVILRGSMVYLLLFLLLRILRREAGALGLSDLVVVVLIADAAQNAMATDYKSITEGAILVCTIAFWDYFIDWLGCRFPFFQRLLRPAPLLAHPARASVETKHAAGNDHRRRVDGTVARTGSRERG